MKKLSSIFLLSALTLSAGNAFAEEEVKMATTELMNYIGVAAIISTLVLVLIVCLVLLKTFRVMASILLKDVKVSEVSPIQEQSSVQAVQEKRTFWQKVLSLRPLSEEKDLVIEHEFDGIRELDNPTPGWFMYLFYATIIFAVVYLLNFHVFKLGKLQDEEYVAEMEQAEAAKEAFLAKSANRVDETTVTYSNDPAVISAGQAIFNKNCVACHGDKAQGTVGPNLTDDYWLHGGTIKNIFKTIKYGVPDKGMISWEKQLTPKEIAEVSTYIKSLRGSNPSGAKEPQGVEDKGEELAGDAAAQTETVKEI
ncbi:cytochrome c class I [Pseudopedobacter saltans DSM 12145]|uniref:Cytochrome c class I n=1 Tax=Pseudopedobacter saltans (strain ATCC 51119 / DSM 12145 / JCM 21818 / CCUG 39354 / LMG 10337 / NBRC 100064 / NCIMB 13643) TaxID=762903 RepID=F0S535_PSESL|nr:cbb3-type cytochrome c oxidase N-terminal domain-containing protein [Pseudopedobacter saltans]ADY50952.1 cytochrome c class I [Pseudopedobacter saltans DSM 12145]